MKEACRLAAVCTAWRTAVVALGGRRFLKKQTHEAIRVKTTRTHDLCYYFESYFCNGNGIPVLFGAQAEGAGRLGGVNDRLRAMRAHCMELKASEAALLEWAC